MPDQPHPIRAVIIDDEQLARAIVREHLSSHPEIQILGECANGFEAVKLVTEQNPDLLFLDIQSVHQFRFSALYE